MTVGFYLVDKRTPDAAMCAFCAEALVESVRTSMPGVPVVQFTDESTDAVPGVDEVRRLPTEPMAMLRMKHQASVTGDWLFVDADVIVQRDVRNVFSRSFDVALTTRNWPHLKVAAGFSERMPFNVGVVFSRNHKFWREIYARVGQMTIEWQEWMGDQQAICDLVKTRPRFTIALLKGSRYNMPPSLDDQDGISVQMQAKAAIVHYKGLDRKQLLIDRMRREAEVCA